MLATKNHNNSVSLVAVTRAYMHDTNGGATLSHFAEFGNIQGLRSDYTIHCTPRLTRMQIEAVDAHIEWFDKKGEKVSINHSSNMFVIVGGGIAVEIDRVIKLANVWRGYSRWSPNFL